mgnify:CR=1 FL=1
MISPNKIRSFTLVELLIVIAILAILAAAVVIVINPGEMLAEARDSQRVTDIRSLKDAVDLFVLDNPGVSLGTSQVISISIPDTSATCANISGLPTLPAGWSYRCVTAANLKNLDSTGWLPINLTSIKGGSPIPYLPTDPQNDQATTKYYQYIPGATASSYELTAMMESEKETKVAAKDGGTDPGRLETGSDTSLWKTASGIKDYWGFNENGGTTVIDSVSGAVSAINGGAVFSAGKFGSSALTFDGTDDEVVFPSMLSMDSDNWSISWWMKRSVNAYEGIFARVRLGSNGQIEVKSGGGIRIESTTNGTWEKSFASTTKTYDGEWHHYAVAFRPTESALYIDGQLFGTATANNDTATFNLQYIGTQQSQATYIYGNWLHGTIDEVAIYDRALTATEVKAIYNAAK